MAASKSFQMAVREGATGAATPAPVTFTLADLEGVQHSFTATFPKDGTLLLFMAAQAEDTDEATQAAAVFDLLREIFEPEQFRKLRAWLKDGAMTPDLLTEIMTWLIEEWAAFPTQPPSGSSAPRTTTGTRSTGRVRATASTPQLSPSGGS